MAVKTDLENCDSNPRGTWFDGCKVAMRDIVKMFLLSPRANLDATDVLSKTTIAGLIKRGLLIPINDILSVSEAGAKTNYQTLPNKRKLFVSNGLYEFNPDVEANICYVKALHSLSKKNWELLVVDSEGRLFFDNKAGKLRGYDLNVFIPGNETVNDGGSKIAMVTIDIQLSQDGTKGYNTRRSFKVDSADDTYFTEIKGKQDVVISNSGTSLDITQFRLNVLAGCDGTSPIEGLTTENILVKDAATGAPIAVTWVDNNDGTYTPTGLTAGDRVIQLFDSVLNLPVADIENSQFYQSNALAVSLTD